MSKVLLAGIAALSVLGASAAHAASEEQLPNEDACMERDEEGTCVRVCVAGPQKCVVRAVPPTPPLTAEEKKWRADFRKCEIRRLFSIGDDEGQAFDVGGGQISVSIGPDDIREIEKGLAVLKKCNAFYQCVVDRDAGKVKHCYENDRRWKLP
jgi:hypothetical protein